MYYLDINDGIYPTLRVKLSESTYYELPPLQGPSQVRPKCFIVPKPSSSPTSRNGETKMGSRLRRRVIHFANLPIKLLMPTNFTNIREIALKTIPSASKIEIKRVLESLYGFDVDEVRTLNMEGKKKKRGGLLIAKPDYKKAYVTLRTPLSIPENVYPINVIMEDRQSISKNAKNKSLVAEEGEKKKHWLDGIQKEPPENVGKGRDRDGSRRGQRSDSGGSRRGPRPDSGRGGGGEVKFPWSSMRRGS